MICFQPPWKLLPAATPCSRDSLVWTDGMQGTCRGSLKINNKILLRYMTLIPHGTVTASDCESEMTRLCVRPPLRGTTLHIIKKIISTK